jgi:hypothetical protein
MIKSAFGCDDLEIGRALDRICDKETIHVFAYRRTGIVKGEEGVGFALDLYLCDSESIGTRILAGSISRKGDWPTFEEARGELARWRGKPVDVFWIEEGEGSSPWCKGEHER